MKKINTREVYDKLLPELLKMNVEVPADVSRALENARKTKSGPACTVLTHIMKNIEIADRKRIPMCQDTGFVIVFVEIGREIELSGESIDLQINQAVEDSSIGAGGVVVLPFYHGERTPNLPHGKGCLRGLDVDNMTPANIARASMEAAVFGLRLGLGLRERVQGRGRALPGPGRG